MSARRSGPPRSGGSGGSGGGQRRPGSGPDDRRGPRSNDRRGPRERPGGRPGGSGGGGGSAPGGGFPDVDLLYGRNAVLESLRAGRRRARTLLIASSSSDDDVRDVRIVEMQSIARRSNVRVKHITRQFMDEQILGNHQGVALETSLFPYATELERPDRAPDDAFTGIWLALDGLQDPQNVGTLLRAAEAFSIAGVVIPQDRAAHITPAVVNASAGAVEHLNVARVVNLTRWLQQARNAGMFAVGLDGVEEAQDITTIDLRPPIVLVVGAEGSGIRRLVAEQCDLLARIPMTGTIESLNAAVAGSIGLWEIHSQLEG